MLQYLIVFLGAGLGGALRHGVNVAAARLLGSGFPYGTFVVNVVGSCAMGLLSGLFLSRLDPSQSIRLLLTTGLLGGLTTFSTFSLDLVLLLERHEWTMAGLYVSASVGLAVAGLFVGLFVTQ